MGIAEKIQEHITKPRIKQLESDIEFYDIALKRYDEAIELADDERMGFFLEVIVKKKQHVESVLLASGTSPNIREQCIGEMKALNAMLNWKGYYINAIAEAKRRLKETKEELDTGERPDDIPND